MYKKYLKSVAEKEISKLREPNISAKLLKTWEGGFNSVKYHWAATEHPLMKTLFAWEVSGFYGEKKYLDRFVGLEYLSLKFFFWRTGK